MMTPSDRACVYGEERCREETMNYTLVYVMMEYLCNGFTNFTLFTMQEGYLGRKRISRELMATL